MSFVKKLSTGQTSILDGQVLKRDPENLAEDWAEEFQQDTMVGSMQYVCTVFANSSFEWFSFKYQFLPEIAGGVGILGQNAESVGEWYWVSSHVCASV